MSTEIRRANFVVIGENVHTTRVLLKRGKRYISGEDGGSEGITFTDNNGNAGLLPIPDWASKTQEYEAGRIKHVMIAVRTAMAGGDDAEIAVAYLRALVANQEKNGSTYLDINVDEISIHMSERQEAMAWAVTALRGMSKLPIAVDSSDMEVIATGLDACAGSAARPMLNSASLERSDAVDLAVKHNARVVLTAAGESGMPDGVEQRLTNAGRMIKTAEAKGIARSDMFVDPLFFPVSVNPAFGLHGLDAIKGLRECWGPEIHITGGVSNVSFGIPSRKTINDVFMILGTEVGLDSGIIDPNLSPPSEVFAMDRERDDYRLAENVILGRDEGCRTYIKAWRTKQRETKRAAR